METLKTFVQDTVQEGNKEAKEIEELKQILSVLDEKEKAIYLRRYVKSNA